jgi:GntR family phosphonate transport system transcriptional regulator
MTKQAVWRDIYDTLRREISGGQHRTGDRLPTEKALSARFGVNRHTVRRALAELTIEGVIAVRRGSGAYVAEGIIDYPIGARVKFSQNISQLGRVPTHRLLSAQVIAADETVARHLNLRLNAPVAQIDTIGEADSLPINYVEQFLPLERFPGIIDGFRESLSLTKALAAYGVVDYRRAWTRVMARAPSRLIASHLCQSELTPVLRSEGVNLDMAGAPIEYAVGYWAGGRAQFVVEVN